MSNRFFSVDEARNLLPMVSELVGNAILLMSRMRRLSPEIQVLAENREQNSGSGLGTAYVVHLVALQDCVARVQDTGCRVKSIEDGLIDFPHIRNGREVLLCWKYGEPDIRFWREVDQSLTSRNPLDDSDPS